MNKRGNKELFIRENYRAKFNIDVFVFAFDMNDNFHEKEKNKTKTTTKSRILLNDINFLQLNFSSSSFLKIFCTFYTTPYLFLNRSTQFSQSLLCSHSCIASILLSNFILSIVQVSYSIGSTTDI